MNATNQITGYSILQRPKGLFVMKTVKNRYRILSEIGKGGMSTVYLARDLTLNKSWAIKEIPKSSEAVKKRKADRLLEEAELMKDLSHPALPRIVDITEDERFYYIVMDYVEGENLKELLREGGAFPQEKVVRWGKELLEALSYLHQRKPPVIYRDMKPANIILQPEGHLKLIDFGAATRLSEERLLPLGTGGYAAPEQFERGGKEVNVDARTDIYALGKTLQELLTGISPTEENVPIRVLDSSLSSGLEKVILKATRKNPSERYQTAQEFLEELSDYRKLDDEFIKSQKRILKKAAVPLVMGLILLVSGIGLLVADHLITSERYESLVMDTGNPKTHTENLLKAARLSPERPEAYSALMDEFTADGHLTEKESEVILSCAAEAAGRAEKKTDSWLEINRNLGEGYLVYFTGGSDDSVRNRILSAEPFFREVEENADESFEGYDLCCAYAYLAKFYREYICASGPFTKDAGRKELRDFMKTAERMVNLAKENATLELTGIRICCSICESEKKEMAAHLEKGEALAFTEFMKKTAKNAEVKTKEDEEMKTRTLKICEEAEEIIVSAYENEKKAEKK